MSSLVQSIVAFGIVAGAALFIGRQIWSQIAAFRKKDDGASSGCGACGSCGGAEKTTATAQLITLSAPPKRIRVGDDSRDRMGRN